jgi:hypothetical protein
MYFIDYIRLKNVWWWLQRMTHRSYLGDHNMQQCNRWEINKQVLCRWHICVITVCNSPQAPSIYEYVHWGAKFRSYRATNTVSVLYILISLIVDREKELHLCLCEYRLWLILCEYRVWIILCEYRVWLILCEYRAWLILCEYRAWLILCEYRAWLILCEYRVWLILCEYRVWLILCV